MGITQEDTMKKLILTTLIISSAIQAQTAPQNADARLIDQFALSVNWMQHAGEYKALAYQAFNAATLAYDNASIPSGKTKTVIVDLDETLLDNSPYMAWEAATGNNYNSAPDSWYEWTKAAQAQAIPGALAFAQHVAQTGGRLYYISNRKADPELAPTLANLKTLGFPNANEQTVLLKTDTSNKQPRIDQVAKTDNNHIILYIGDNLNDYGEATYKKDTATRNAFVDAHQKDFGTKYIILPNPIYGDWESGLAKDYWNLTPEEQLKARHHALQQWQPTLNK